MPSAITWGGTPGQLRQGLLAPRALHPNTTHRFDLLTVQLTAICDHGVDDVPQAGGLHVGVLDKHKVLWESAEPAGSRRGPGSLGPPAYGPTAQCPVSLGHPTLTCQVNCQSQNDHLSPSPDLSGSFMIYLFMFCLFCFEKVASTTEETA